MKKILQSLVLLLDALMVAVVVYDQGIYIEVNGGFKNNITDMDAVIDNIKEGAALTAVACNDKHNWPSAPQSSMTISGKSSFAVTPFAARAMMAYFL